MKNLTEKEIATLKEMCKNLLLTAKPCGEYSIVSDTLVPEEIDLLKKIAGENETKEKKITDFLRVHDMLSLVAFINEYEDARCALDAEAFYYLWDYEAFYHFAVRYGLETAKKCKEESPLWVGGSNFLTPQVVDDSIDYLLKLIDGLVEDEYVGLYPEIFDKYIKFDEYFSK